MDELNIETDVTVVTAVPLTAAGDVTDVVPVVVLEELVDWVAEVETCVDIVLKEAVTLYVVVCVDVVVEVREGLTDVVDVGVVDVVVDEVYVCVVVLDVVEV